MHDNVLLYIMPMESNPGQHITVKKTANAFLSQLKNDAGFS